MQTFCGEDSWSGGNRLGLTRGLDKSRATSRSEFYIWRSSVLLPKDVLEAAGSSEKYLWQSKHKSPRCTPESKWVSRSSTGLLQENPAKVLAVPRASQTGHDRNQKCGLNMCRLCSSQYAKGVGLIDWTKWSSLHGLAKVSTRWKKQC